MTWANAAKHVSLLRKLLDDEDRVKSSIAADVSAWVPSGLLHCVQYQPDILDIQQRGFSYKWAG